MSLEEADPADRGRPQDRHHRDQRPALLVVADHCAERPRQAERDQQDEEDLEPVGERVRVLERVGRVGVVEAAAVVAQLLDDFLGRHRPADDGLVPAGQRGHRVVGGEVLHHAARDQDDRAEHRQRQQQPQHGPGHVHPEVAEPVGPGPDEPADDRDRDREPDRGGEEVLHRQAAHLGQVAHRGFAGVVLPVGVGGERDCRVPRGVRRDVGHPDGQEQPVLRALDQVQEQHADRGERQHGPGVAAPPHVRVRVDAGQLVDAALHPPVAGAGEDAGDVVAERHVARGKGGDQQQPLQPARGRRVHQNRSGRTRATNR